MTNKKFQVKKPREESPSIWKKLSHILKKKSPRIKTFPGEDIKFIPFTDLSVTPISKETVKEALQSNLEKKPLASSIKQMSGKPVYQFQNSVARGHKYKAIKVSNIRVDASPTLQYLERTLVQNLKQITGKFDLSKLGDKRKNIFSLPGIPAIKMEELGKKAQEFFHPHIIDELTINFAEGEHKISMKVKSDEVNAVVDLYFWNELEEGKKKQLLDWIREIYKKIDIEIVSEADWDRFWAKNKGDAQTLGGYKIEVLEAYRSIAISKWFEKRIKENLSSKDILARTKAEILLNLLKRMNVKIAECYAKEPILLEKLGISEAQKPDEMIGNDSVQDNQLIREVL